MLRSEQPSERVRRVFRNDVQEYLTDLLGPRYARYRAAWNRAGPDAVPAFPVHLDLELFDNCNQRCVFCPRDTEQHPDLPYPINTGARLGAAAIDGILLEAEAGGLYSINLGAFAEPLLNREVFRVVQRFHDAGVVDSRIITNGLLLDRYHDEVFESGLVNLFVSIDAFRAETYAKQRGAGFERVTENLLEFLAIRASKRAALPVVRVSFVVTEDNRDEQDDFVAFWSDRVDFVDVQARTDYRPQAVGAPREKVFHCIDPFRRVAIIGNGDILPCCTFWGRTLPVGNITESSIAEAWNGARLGKVRDDLLADRCAVCVSCQSP